MRSGVKRRVLDNRHRHNSHQPAFKFVFEAARLVRSPRGWIIQRGQALRPGTANKTSLNVLSQCNLQYLFSVEEHEHEKISGLHTQGLSFLHIYCFLISQESAYLSYKPNSSNSMQQAAYGCPCMLWSSLSYSLTRLSSSTVSKVLPYL